MFFYRKLGILTRVSKNWYFVACTRPTINSKLAEKSAQYLLFNDNNAGGIKMIPVGETFARMRN